MCLLAERSVIAVSVTEAAGILIVISNTFLDAIKAITVTCETRKKLSILA